MSVRNHSSRNFDPGPNRKTKRLSTPNQVEIFNLQALPVGNDADRLGREPSWRTQTIVSCKAFLGLRIAPKNANFQMSLPSIISTVQAKPVRRMRHSSLPGSRLLVCNRNSRSWFVCGSLCVRLISQLLHRPSHPFRDEFGERPDVHIDACPIQRPQIVIAILNPDDGPRIAA
jgi:hypothetical protein